MKANDNLPLSDAARRLKGTTLTPLEKEIIGFFVHLARLLDLPKSIAEIYGVLYVSATPLSMEDIMKRLALSKGSASQGLNFLRNLGAILPIDIPNSRREHFVAETELRKLVSGFLKERLVPHLEDGQKKLERVEHLLATASPEQRNFLGQRIEKLRQWEKRGSRFLPLVAKLMG